MATVILIIGVSGAGKTTVGRLLAQQLGWRFYDADDFHPPANVDKMRRGVALDDTDRWPWLRALHERIQQCLDQDINAVLACSALKHAYQEFLARDRAHVKVVFLTGSRALIAQRLGLRTDHFMNPALLQSQFDTLEAPRDALTVDVTPPPEQIVARLRARLGL